MKFVAITVSPDSEPKSPPSFISTRVTEARRYYFDLNPKAGSETAIVCGGCERMRADYMIDRADFPFLAIECVAEGAGTLELGGVQYGLTPGVVFFYGPGVAHRITSDSSTPMFKYYIDFVGKAANQLLADSALAAGRVVQLSSPQEVIDIFELLQREGMSESGSGPKNCAALLPFLIMKINELAIPYGAPDFRAVETYERAKRLMEERFLSLRSVDEAARACHIDSSYLSRLFQRFAHTTPSRFLTKLKMNRAATLLLDQGMRVNEAADALGFTDAFHFSRTFKRVYGISPDHFIRHGRSAPARL